MFTTVRGARPFLNRSSQKLAIGLTKAYCQAFNDVPKSGPPPVPSRITQLNDELTRERQQSFVELRDSIASTQNLAKPLVEQGIRLSEQRIFESPLHIGFMAQSQFFAEDGSFLPGGVYKNAQLRSIEHGGQGQFARGFEDRTAAPDQQPVYAASNFTMRGHRGWGYSCFVLKPHLRKYTELHSRDTGDPDGIGPFAMKASYASALPILKDWNRMSCLKDYWGPLTSTPRMPISERYISASTPIEAAIYIPGGLLKPSDIALIFIDMGELKEGVEKEGGSVEDRIAALSHFAESTGVPIEYLHQGSRFETFQTSPLYREVLKSYRTD